MPYRFDTQGLTSQQKAIINQRDKNNKLIKESSQENVVKKEYKLSEEEIKFLSTLSTEGEKSLSVIEDKLKNNLKNMQEQGYISISNDIIKITNKGLKNVR